MIVNYEELEKKICGARVPKPISGTLSGHAAGEPFDKLVYEILKEQNKGNVFKQFEYLNNLFSANLDAKSIEDRNKLIENPTMLFILARGKDVTKKWSPDNQFQEKQNDTVDILVEKEGMYELIDVKTRNISKNAQPPNIISSFKLANICAKMIDNNNFSNINMRYFGIDWELIGGDLVAIATHKCNLFKIHPDELYINWAAAMQIQFHVSSIDQTFKGSQEDWCRAYLKMFIESARKRADQMIENFVKPFEKYVVE